MAGRNTPLAVWHEILPWKRHRACLVAESDAEGTASPSF